MAWWLIIPLIAILAFWGENERDIDHRSKYYCRAAIVLLFAYIAGIGGPSAQDHQWYALLYEDIKYSSTFNFSFYWGKSAEGYEIGYMLLNYIGKLCKLGNAGFFFFIALLINAIVINYIFKFRNAALFVCFSFVSESLIQQSNLIRQTLAATVFLFSIRYLVDKKLIKYVGCVLLAMTLHLSAFILFVFAPLCLVKSPKSEQKITSLLWATWGVSLLISMNVLSIDNIGLFSFLSGYELYMTTENSVGMEYSIVRIFFFNIITCFFIALNERKYSVQLVILTFATFLINCSVQMPNLARLGSYFGTVSFVYIFNSLSDIQYTKKIPVLHQAKYIIAIYVVYLALTHFIISNETLLFTNTYQLSDFFN